MRTAKIIFFLILTVLFAENGFAQSREEVYPDRQESAKQVQLFPNPATDFVTIKFEQPQAKKVKLFMTSILGNPLELEVENLDEYEVRIKVRDLPAGYYFLAIHDEETRTKSTYKFLKR